ncbi:putative secreted protein (Por secretion system target) [Pontibacter ummariensis]|uniref:Por secretion system C-terminal sorting domain-containing protein n=1 Tax=Pontibacter ummariensis TaxID=1610492 RepID=A0A239L1N5_9BACT|nr:T9SS type A sorting domain-containing protein [Pontibacter ummariensis]PRY04631.1 putative secreted protein (Por secretion system target) [Pontibacter ummariensis]SNT23828.1 Por secretion system C-terminal sorting domain-containing protein [Pontibacter ummariensis]
MKQFILLLFASLSVLLVQAQARNPVQVQASQQEERDKPLNLQRDEDVSIYPNPSNGVFTVSVSNLRASEVKLSIMNVIGNEIYSETLAGADAGVSKTVDLNRFAKGLYYVKLEADKFSTVRRVVVK